MHKVKLFSVPISAHGYEAKKSAVDDLNIDVNIWFADSKEKHSALVVHDTDMVLTDDILIYSIYYTYLPNDTEKDNQTGGEPEKSGPEAATIGAR